MSTFDEEENGRVAPMAQKQQERESAIRLYTETTMTVGGIAQMLKVSRTTVHNWLREAGVPLRGGGGPRGPRRQAAATVDVGSLEEAADAVINGQALLRAEVAAAGNLTQENSRQITELRAAVERLQGTMDALLAILGNKPPPHRK